MIDIMYVVNMCFIEAYRNWLAKINENYSPSSKVVSLSHLHQNNLDIYTYVIYYLSNYLEKHSFNQYKKLQTYLISFSNNFQ